MGIKFDGTYVKNMTINKDLKYGIVDEALPQGQEDSLDVAKYS